MAGLPASEVFEKLEIFARYGSSRTLQHAELVRRWIQGYMLLRYFCHTFSFVHTGYIARTVVCSGSVSAAAKFVDYQ